MLNSRRSARRVHVGPPIVDVEMRVLALRDAEGAGQPRQRAGLEGAVGLDRRAPGGAPRQRNRQPRALAERVDDGGPPAIGPPIAVVVVKDREEHQPAAQAAERRSAARRSARCRASRGRAARARLRPSPACGSACGPGPRRSGRCRAAASRSASVPPASSGAPTAMPASLITASSLSVALPWTRISAIVSCAAAAGSDGAIAARRAARRSLRTSFGTRDLRRDVGLAIVRELALVGELHRTERERHAGVDRAGCAAARRRERLAHLHRRAEVVDLAPASRPAESPSRRCRRCT